MQGDDHWRTLVTDRGLVRYKLLGNSNSFPSPSGFTKNTPHPLTVYLYMDNTTAILYLNHKGRRTSPSLSTLVKQTWQRCMSQNISLVANHLPGHLNTVADRESRILLDRQDWQLHPKIFLKINQIWRPLTIDLFASRPTHQLPAYFSWRPDPHASAMHAFLQGWSEKICYANHPWGLMLKVLSEISHQQTDVIIVAPIWKGQSWFPVLHLIFSSTGPILSQ